MSDTTRLLSLAAVSVISLTLHLGVASAKPGTPQASAPIGLAPQPATTQVADNQAGQKPPKERKVCRRVAAPIGTRIGARTVCRTAADWRRQEAIAKDVTDEVQSVGRLMNPVGE